MKRTSVIALGAGLWLFGAVPGALASGASPPQPTDPKASSPAGTVYEIPLDAARSDAAPHRRSSAPAGGTSGGGAGTGPAASGSGGSASGSAGGAGASRSVGTASGGAAASASSTDPGSYVHSENGFGSSSQVPGLGGASKSAAAASPAALSGGGGSAPTGSLALIGVVLLVGAYAGIFASRRARA